MKNTVIRNHKNEITGYIRETGPKTVLIFDSKNNQIGTVINKITRDKNNQFYGYGDQSGRLLGESTVKTGG